MSNRQTNGKCANGAPTGIWGYDEFRVCGTRGLVESTALRGEATLQLSLEDELHPTRIVLRARRARVEQCVEFEI